MKGKSARSSKMADFVRDLRRSPKVVDDIDARLLEIIEEYDDLMDLRELAAKKHRVIKQPPTFNRTVITQRRHAPYPTEPVKDLEVREHSRPWIVNKVLTDAGRPITYRQLRERFIEVARNLNLPVDEKAYYSGIQALKKNGHCCVYRGYITTPDVLKQFQADVAAGRAADVEEMPRFNSRWAEEITKYLKERGDWVSSKEVADHLATLPVFEHVQDTYTRTCLVLANLKQKRGLVEKFGTGRGTKWRLTAAGEENERNRATEGVPSVARH